MQRQETTLGGALLAWTAFLGLTWPEERPLAPTFTLPDLQGHPVSLAAYREKLVLINFWATWCRECVREMPELEKLYQAYKPKGLTVLAVALDQAGTGHIEEFLAQEVIRATFPILLDPERRTAKAYRVRGIPVTMIVGRDGTLIGAVYGAQRWGSPAILKQVKSLLTGGVP